MSELSDDARPSAPRAMLTELNRTTTLRIEQIVVRGARRRVSNVKVGEVMASIKAVGLLSHIVVVQREDAGGKVEYCLVAGLHRLEAMKRLGETEAICVVLGHGDALRAELAQIDENFVRHDPSAAEHALLTARRREIIHELGMPESTLSQNQTAWLQGRRRDGEVTGPNVGSLRYQANQTGESRDKIHRSTKRFDTLGHAVLESLVGTSLDSGVELDALVKIPDKARREELAKSAAAGAEVSAKHVLRQASSLTLRRRRVRPSVTVAAFQPRQQPLLALLAFPPWSTPLPRNGLVEIVVKTHHLIPQTLSLQQIRVFL
jgi:hypothetical protein